MGRRPATVRDIKKAKIRATAENVLPTRSIVADIPPLPVVVPVAAANLMNALYAVRLKKNVYPVVMFRDGKTLESPMRVVNADGETFFYSCLPQAVFKDENVLVRKL